MPTKEQRQHKLDVCNTLYNKIASFIVQYGYPPSIREMADLAEISSTSMVKYYLVNMKNWGWITFEENKARTVRLMRPANEVLSTKSHPMKRQLLREQIRPFVPGERIPTK